MIRTDVLQLQGTDFSVDAGEQVAVAGYGLGFHTALDFHFECILGVLLEGVPLYRDIAQFAVPNAAQRATPPKVPKHEMEVFEPEEVQTILKALGEEPMKWRVITTLLIATGARRGEIMGLRWENVDWDSKRLYLCENRVYTKASGTISTTLKTGENRYVSVPASVLELLEIWKAEQTANCRMLGNHPPAYIATHEDGELARHSLRGHGNRR